MYDLCNAMWVKRFYFCNCLKWIHAGYLSSTVQLYNFKYNFKINQLTPVQAVTGRDEHLPLFQLCKHHLWSKLASFTLVKFCRKKRSLQWYPEIWMKILRKLSENMRAKRPSGTFSYSIVRNACLKKCPLIQDFLKLEASLLEGLWKKTREGEKGTG